MPLARGDPVETARRAAASSLRRTWAAACPADTSAGVLRTLVRPAGLLGGCWAGTGTFLRPSPEDNAVARRAGDGENAARCHGLSLGRERQPMPPPPIIPLRKAAESVMPSWLV